MNWMIRHRDDRGAWWHINFGWTTYEKATVFNAREKEAYHGDAPRSGIWKIRRA